MRIALKIDVDTYRGLEEGAPRLAEFLHSAKIPASFFVTLGPDTSGWAAPRVFRHRGFLKKMKRTSAVKTYGWRTVFSGTLLPARPMATSFVTRLRQWANWGFEVSPHGYDHIAWHDSAAGWDAGRAVVEWNRMDAVFQAVMGRAPESFAAPGWQAGSGTWEAMEGRHLLYHSDTRGQSPYFPQVGVRQLKTLEIPTTLPTWDEMLTWDDVTPESIGSKTLEALDRQRTNVWTLHAEFEGMSYFETFRTFISRAKAAGAEWVFLPTWARELIQNRSAVPVHAIEQATRPGRAGTVTCQAA